MVFHGFQKMTLLDYPGKVAATLFTGGCNFRCPFCHNAMLVTEISNEEVYSEDGVIEFLKKRRGLLDGIAITGGEPLLQNDIEAFMGRVKEFGYLIKLDTNGTFPEKLERIVNSGLADYVAVDIKNSREKYKLTAMCSDNDIANIEKTVDFLMQGRVKFEFRTTVVNELHEVEDIVKISEWIKGDEPYFLQSFVDSGNLITTGLHAASSEKMAEMRQKALLLLPNTQIRGL